MYIWWSNSGLDIFLLTQINVYQEVTSKRYQYSLFRVSWLFTNMSFPFSHLEKTSIFLAWNSKFLTWVGWEKRERREHFIHLHCLITITPSGEFCKNKYKLSTYRDFHTKTNPYFDNLLPRWWVSWQEEVFYEGLYAARLWQPEWCGVMFHVNIKPFCRLTLAW